MCSELTQSTYFSRTKKLKTDNSIYVRTVVGPVSAAPPGNYSAEANMPGGGFALPGLLSSVGYFPHNLRELSSILPLKRRFCIVLVQLVDNPAADSRR